MHDNPGDQQGKVMVQHSCKGCPTIPNPQFFEHCSKGGGGGGVKPMFKNFVADFV